MCLKLSKLVTSMGTGYHPQSYNHCEGHPHVIQHILDQSRFPGDLKTKLLKKIERIDKPNVEIMLIILRLYQKNQGCTCGPKPTVNNVNTGHIGGKKNNSQKDVGGRKCMVSCTENHPLFQCNVYRNKSSAEKLKVVQ